MDSLSEKQKEAVLTFKGPILIVAGAGAGKTRTITERVLALIQSGVSPESILAITFTNKAAKEILERVDSLMSQKLGNETGRPFIGTFHRLGVKIIRENAKEAGLPKNFSIFDRDDSKKAVKEAMKELGIDLNRWNPGAILSLISRQKAELKQWEDLENELGDEADVNYVPGIVYKVWQKYEQILKREKALDFDDLLSKAVSLLQKKEILNHYQNLWQYIHIDEYQDTNKAQYIIANLLASKNKNICVVGDHDQSIYSFRGARFKNIIDFEKDYPDAKIILLEENYRSTKNILDAANEMIKKNKFRIEKNLYTKKEGGEKLSLIETMDESHEAQKITEKIKELIENKVDPKEIAVLYRTNFQSRALEEAFMSLGIPYQVLGTKFFERKEVKDIVSFIKASLNPENFGDIKRIANVPPRGIGKVTLLKILEGREGELKGKTQSNVLAFKKLLSRIKEETVKKYPGDLIKFVLEESGLKTYLENNGTEEKERLENILELINLAARYGDTGTPEEALQNFLTDFALVSDQDSLDKSESAVKLMTVHASKGLEFDYVFIAGLEEDLFPQQRPEMKEEEREEERRLFYVALTRARKKVFLSYAGSRGMFGTRLYNVPSSFIKDIPEELLEVGEEISGFLNIEF